MVSPLFGYVQKLRFGPFYAEIGPKVNETERGVTYLTPLYFHNGAMTYFVIITFLMNSLSFVATFTK